VGDLPTKIPTSSLLSSCTRHPPSGSTVRHEWESCVFFPFVNEIAGSHRIFVFPVSPIGFNNDTLSPDRIDRATWAYVNRDRGNVRTTSDWFNLCGLSVYGPGTVPFVGVFVDKSGSMTTTTPITYVSDTRLQRPLRGLKQHSGAPVSYKEVFRTQGKIGLNPS